MLGIGTVSASENVTDVDMTLGDSNSGSPVYVDNWASLESYCESTNDDYTICLNGSFSIGSQIEIKNNVNIIGDANYFIGGTADNVDTYSSVPFLCSDELNVTFTNVNFQYTGGKNLMQFNGNGNYDLENCNFINVNSGSDRSIILSNSGLTNVVDSTFSGCNAQSGVIINNANLLVSNSVFENNIATLWAGAIHTNAYATTDIYDSIFRSNRAGWNGGALYDYGTLYIYNTIFDSNNCTTNNGGGAIGACKLGTSEPYLYVVNSTFINNINKCSQYDSLSTTSLGRGGAISFMDDGTLKVYNNTFINNDAVTGSAICAISQGSYGSPDVEIVGNNFTNQIGPRGSDVLVVSLSNSNYLVENNTYSNNKISVGKFRLDIDDNNGLVTVNITLRLKHPEDYDSDIITKSGFDVYVDNVYNKTVYDTTFTLNFADSVNHNVKVVPLCLAGESRNKNINDANYNTIYVSTTGSDNNNGISRNTAVRTISKAIELASTVDYIKILEGTYYERGLTLSNITIEGEGNVILDGSASSANTFIADASVIFKNLQFTGITSNSAISITSETGNDYLITVSNCSFYSNNVAGKLINAKDLNIADSIFYGNIVNYLVYSSGYFNMINTNIYSNAAKTTSSNGLVYVNNGFILNSSFSNNIVRWGVIYINGEDVTIQESNFIKNNATFNAASYGGAIYGKKANNINVVSSIFYNNIANYWGGAIYLTNTVVNLNITDSILIDNIASKRNYQIDRQGTTSNIYAINNWWGNTINNAYIAPTFFSNTNVNASIWLILNVTSNVTSLTSGESALVTFDLTYTNILGSDASDETVEGNLTPFCIDGVYLPILNGVLTANNGVVNESDISIVDGKLNVLFTATDENSYLSINILGISETISFINELRINELINKKYVFQEISPVKHSYSNDLLSYAPGPNDFDPDAEDYRIMDIIIKIYDNCVYFSPQFVYEGGVWPSMFCWMDEDLLYGEYMESGLPDEYYDGNDNFYINISFFNTTLDKWQIVVEDSYHMPFPDYYEVFDEGSMTKTRFYLFNFTKGLYKVSYAYTGQTFEYEYYDYDNDEEIADTYTYLPSSGEYIIDLNKEFFIPKINNLESIVTYEGNDLNILPSISIIANGTIKGGYFSDDGFGDSFDLNVQSKSFDYKITFPNREIELIPWIEYDLNDFPQVKQVNITMTVTQGDKVIGNPFSVAPGSTYSLEGLAAGEYNLTAVYDDPYYGYATKTVSISIYGNHIWETEGADIGYSHKTDYSGPKNIQELWNLSVNNFQGPVIDFDGNIYIANGTNIVLLNSNGKVINTYSMNNPSKGLLLWKDLLFTSRFSTFDDGAEWFRINDVMSDRNYELIPTGAGNDATSRSEYAPVYSDGKIIYIIPEYGTNSYTRAHLLVYNADEPSGRTITYQGQTRPAYGTISKSSTFARETGAASVDSAGNIYVNTWDGLIIFNSNLVKYDLSFGDAGSYGRPVIDSVDNVYVFNSDRTKVYAINIDDEKTMLWNKTIAGGACGVMAVDVENNALYIVGNDGIVYSFNRANGEMSEFFNLGTNASSILVDGKGTLYIGGKNGILYAISNEGKKLFEYEIGGTINANIVLDNNETLYVHANGKLFALTRAPKLYSEIIINVSDGEVNRNNTIVAILPENATGNVTFIIDDTITSGDIPIINGNATWSAPGLKEGNHRVTVTWIGNDDYNGNTKTEEFNIYKVNSTIDLEDSINYVGKLTQLNITLPEDAVGNVTVTFNRKTESVKIVNGTATFETTPLEAGNYTIDFSWDGDERYFGNSSYAYFTVIKNDAALTIDADSIKEGEDLKVTVTLSDDESGMVLIMVGDVKDFAEIKDGKAEFTISGLTADTYDINATYLGDNKYYNTTETSPVTVSAKDTATIEISPEVITEDDKQSIEVTLPDDATGNVLVKVNGNTFYAEVNGGKINVPVSGLKANTTYPVTVTYGGNDIYSETTEEGEVTTPEEPVVEPKDSNLKLDIDGTVITVSINDAATGDIIVTVGDIAFVQDASELAPIDVSEYLSNATYPVTVKYLGDDVFANATQSGSVTVPDELVIEPKDPNLKVTAANTTITVTVNKDAAGYVVVEIGDVSFYAEIENGKAVIDVVGLEPNTYAATVSYSGDGVFKADEASVKVTVPGEPVVEPKDSNLKATVKETVISVSVNKDAAGYVVVEIGGVSFYAEIENGKAVIDVVGLEPNTYAATVSYSGDGVFKADEASVKVTVPGEPVVEPKDPGLKATVKETVISVSVNKDAAGYVVVEIGGVSFYAEIENGKAVIDVVGLEPNTYAATVSYSGDGVFKADEASVKVTVPEGPVVELKDPGLKATVKETVISVSVNKDAAGYVLVDVDGQGYYAKINDGKATVDVSGLDAGDYTASVTYLGDGVFKADETSVKVTVPGEPVVEPKDPGLKATVKETVISVSVNKDATGYVLVDVDGQGYYATINDGKAVIEVIGLDAGTYTAVVSYAGDDVFGAANATVSVAVPEEPVVEPKNPNLKATAVNNTITVTVDKDASGNVLVDVDGQGYYATINDGKAVIEVIGLDEGKYQATVNYLGDDVFKAASATVSVTVPKKEDTASESVDPKAKMEITNTTIGAELPKDATGYVLVDVDGTGYYVPVKDGKASFDLPELAPGNHTVTVTYAGDKKYDSSSVSKTIAVVNPVETIVAENLTKIEKSPERFVAKFSDKDGKALANTKVTFAINGGSYTRTTDANGVASFAISLPAGTYTMITTNPVTGDTKENSITVLSRFVENRDVTKYFRNATQYVLKVLGDDGKPAAAGEVVTFNINGVFYNRTVNATGHVKMNINLNPGNYVITAEYKGCKVSNNIKVLPVLTGKDLTKKFGEPGQFEATLVDGQGKAYANQKISFNINGVFYERTTNANGIAKLNINLQPGVYIITSTYGQASISNKVTVTA